MQQISLGRKLKTKQNNDKKKKALGLSAIVFQARVIIFKHSWKPISSEAQRHIYQKNGKEKSCLLWFVLAACTKYRNKGALN